MAAATDNKLTEAEEKDILDYMLQMTKIANPKTRKDLPRIVKYVLDKKRRKLFAEGNNLPSATWVQSFLKRHTTESSKIPNGRNPKLTISYDNLKRFFSRLTIYLAEEHNLNAVNFLRRCNGHRIFTCDEGVFHLNVNEYNSKKSRNIKKFSKFDAEGKNTRTVLLCVSASGNVLKPLIVNSGSTTTQYDSEFDDKYWIDFSEKGFMTAKVFYHWLVNCFEPYLTQTHIERPVVLFLDGHFCQLNIPSLLFAKKKEIILYCLPSDGSHIVQPIDSACFKLIEENYKSILKENANTAGIIPPKMFPLLMLKTMQKSRLQNQAIAGFEETGLVPFSPETVDKSKMTTTNGTADDHEDLPLNMDGDKEKAVPTYEDSIVVITAELNALQDFLLRIETILPRPYVAHFEEKHEAGEDVLDHSFFIWRDLKEKIRDIQTWLLQAQEENPHLFQNSDPSIHLISQDNPASFVQLQANDSLQNQIINFQNQNALINFPEGSDSQNPAIFHENATLQNVIETFPENSLENFQEGSNAQQGSIEGFSECSTPANPIVTFPDAAQHHIECFTESTGNQDHIENFSSYQNSVEIYTENSRGSSEDAENENDSAKTSPVVGRRASERGSPIKGKINLGSLYNRSNPVVSLVRTPITNGKIIAKSSPPSSGKKTTPKTKVSIGKVGKIATKKTAKGSPKAVTPTKKEKAVTPTSGSKGRGRPKKEDATSNQKRKSTDSQMSPKSKKNKTETSIDSEGSCIVCKKKDGSNKVWIGCECGNWCHKECVNVSLKLSKAQVEQLEFKCSFCKKRKR